MRNYKAGAISTLLTGAVIVFMTIYAELSEPFKNALKSITGHHWISKSLISLILFFILYFAFGKVKIKENDVWKYTQYVFWAVLFYSLIILLFFLFHFFK